MTCGEKQEMHYHRYLNLSEYFVHSVLVKKPGRGGGGGGGKP